MDGAGPPVTLPRDILSALDKRAELPAPCPSNCRSVDLSAMSRDSVTRWANIGLDIMGAAWVPVAAAELELSLTSPRLRRKSKAAPITQHTQNNAPRSPPTRGARRAGATLARSVADAASSPESDSGSAWLGDAEFPALIPGINASVIFGVPVSLPVLDCELVVDPSATDAVADVETEAESAETLA